MKKLIITCCVSLLILISCGKKKDLMSEGNIIGQDAALCACCGGWFIEIDNNTYRFNNLPEDSELDLMDASFPVSVQLEWIVDSVGCIGDEILINELKKK